MVSQIGNGFAHTVFSFVSIVFIFEKESRKSLIREFKINTLTIQYFVRNVISTDRRKIQWSKFSDTILNCSREIYSRERELRVVTWYLLVIVIGYFEELAVWRLPRINLTIGLQSREDGGWIRQSVEGKGNRFIRPKQLFSKDWRAVEC